MPTFSIIIPVKPGGYVAACEHLRSILPDDPRYEVLLAEGKAPSQQRNLAAREATGEIIYFLDDDSLIDPGNLDRCAHGMENPQVAVIGGPSLTPPPDTSLQQLFGYALASPFGSGGVRNRYQAVGMTRNTTDKELILCNLTIRRSLFIELGGFNERLYPNEENEFMDRLSAAGYTLLHDPEMSIYRSQRRTMKAFIRQMFAYGRGRGEQSLLTGTYPLPSFIPLFFLIYLVLALGAIKYVLLLAPLVVYVAIAFVCTLLMLLRSGKPCTLALLGLFPLMHIVNGYGLLWGLTHGKPAPVHDDAICIRRIKGFNEPFPEHYTRPG